MSEEITQTVANFIRRSGLGKTHVYDLIKRGELETAKIDGTRVVIMASYYRVLERNRVPPRRKPTPGERGC